MIFRCELRTISSRIFHTQIINTGISISEGCPIVPDKEIFYPATMTKYQKSPGGDIVFPDELHMAILPKKDSDGLNLWPLNQWEIYIWLAILDVQY